MSSTFRSVALLFAVVVLSACGVKADRAEAPNDATQILSQFQLVIPDNSGEFAPPVGVLLHIPERGALTICTIGHVREFAVSNAHCIDDARKGGKAVRPSDFHVLYPDSVTGEKRIGKLTEFVKEGAADHDDIFVGRMDSESESHWNSFASVKEAPEGPDSQSAFVWAFDPVPSEFRAIGSPNAKGISQLGAVFSRKSVNLFHRIPLIGFGSEGKSPQSGVPFLPEGKRIDLRIHLFLDTFSPTTVSGNSGGIVTSESGEAIATFHWHRSKKNFSSNGYYFGSQKRWRRIWSSDTPGPGWWSLIGVATGLSSYIPQ